MFVGVRVGVGLRTTFTKNVERSNGFDVGIGKQRVDFVFTPKKLRKNVVNTVPNPIWC